MWAMGRERADKVFLDQSQTSYRSVTDATTSIQIRYMHACLQGVQPLCKEYV